MQSTYTNPCSFHRRVSVLAGLLLLLQVAACDVSTLDFSDEKPGPSYPGTLALALPGPIDALRMVDRDQLRVEGSIGNVPILFTRRQRTNGRETWESEGFVLPGNGMHPLTIRWIETMGDSDLLIADFGPVMLDDSSERAIVIPSSDYNYQHDADNDGATNIAERRMGSDPFDANSRPQEEVTPPDNGRVDISVSIPSEIRAAPFVQLEQVVPEVLYFADDGGISIQQTLIRDGNFWSGQIDERGPDEELLIFWDEIIDSDVVTLGLSSLQDSSNTTTVIRDEDLEFDSFGDDDEDGRENLRERATGTNPLEVDEPSPYNANQNACGTPDFASEALGVNNITPLPFAAPFTLSAGINETVEFSSLADTTYIQVLLEIPTSGQLAIEHRAGSPSDSVIEIWQRRLDGVLSLVQREDDPETGGLRASISVDLIPGGYCFLLVRFRQDSDDTFYSGPLQTFDMSDDGVSGTSVNFSFQ